MTLATQTKPKVNWREAIWGYIFIAPAFIFVFAFVVIPVISAFGISFTDWNLITPAKFVGLQNYITIFTDSVAIKTLLNTFYFTFVSVPIALALSLVLAVLLNQKIRGLTFFRTAYYIPVISSTVAVSMVFLWIFNSDYGLLNQILKLFDITGVKWLTDEHYAMLAVIIVSVWRSLGFNIIIFLAALQDVPKDLHDAAAIDGAGEVQKFFNIIVPLISPALFFTMITGIIGSFQSFDLVYNMTKGGPARATYLVGYYIWEQAFKYLHMGYGAAIAFVLFFFIMVLTIIQWVLRRRWVFGEA
jgi:ABC-type sugar transport systems, permease components